MKSFFRGHRRTQSAGVPGAQSRRNSWFGGGTGGNGGTGGIELNGPDSAAGVLASPRTRTGSGLRKLNPMAILRRLSIDGSEGIALPSEDDYRVAGAIYGTRTHEWGTVPRSPGALDGILEDGLGSPLCGDDEPEFGDVSRNTSGTDAGRSGTSTRTHESTSAATSVSVDVDVVSEDTRSLGESLLAPPAPDWASSSCKNDDAASTFSFEPSSGASIINRSSSVKYYKTQPRFDAQNIHSQHNDDDDGDSELDEDLNIDDGEGDDDELFGSLLDVSGISQAPTPPRVASYYYDEYDQYSRDYDGGDEYTDRRVMDEWSDAIAVYSDLPKHAANGATRQDAPTPVAGTPPLSPVLPLQTKSSPAPSTIALAADTSLPDLVRTRLPTPSTASPRTPDKTAFGYAYPSDYDLDDDLGGLLDEVNAIPDDWQTAPDLQRSKSLPAHLESGPSLQRRHSNVIRLLDNTITLYSKPAVSDHNLAAVDDVGDLPLDLPAPHRVRALTPISERSFDADSPIASPR